MLEIDGVNIGHGLAMNSTSYYEFELNFKVEKQGLMCS